MDDYKANDYDRDYIVCPIARAALMARDVPRRPEDIRRASMCMGSSVRLDIIHILAGVEFSQGDNKTP